MHRLSPDADGCGSWRLVDATAGRPVGAGQFPSAPESGNQFNVADQILGTRPGLERGTGVDYGDPQFQSEARRISCTGKPSQLFPTSVFRTMVVIRAASSAVILG